MSGVSLLLLFLSGCNNLRHSAAGSVCLRQIEKEAGDGAVVIHVVVETRT